LNFLLKAHDAHSIHSSFQFKLYTALSSAKHNSRPEWQQIEQLRKQLKTEKGLLEVSDFGAGSRSISGTKRKISDIAHTSLNTPKWSRVLCLLAEHFKCTSILELGTSLGLNTAYMASTKHNPQVISIEGCKTIAELAKLNIEKLGYTQRVQVKVGRIEEHLPEILQSNIFDLVYIDANHTYEATIAYFNELISLDKRPTLIVFDDIYWSKGMTKAWNEIVNHNQIAMSIDLFKLGIVFTDQSLPRTKHFWELR
jgi:predicted O-methyltransferase YrrM